MDPIEPANRVDPLRHRRALRVLIAAATATVAIGVAQSPPSEGAARSKPSDRAHLVSLGYANWTPTSDGTNLVWHHRAGRIRLLDPLTRRTRTIRVRAGCRLLSANPRGLALLICGAGSAPNLTVADIVRTRDGSLVTRREITGSIDAWGSVWIQSFENHGCYHCDSIYYTDWRTGRRVARDPMDDPGGDLDTPHLRPPPEDTGTDSTVAVEGSARLVEHAVRPRDLTQEMLFVRGRRRQTLGRCDGPCVSSSLQAGRAVWIDQRNDRPSTLHDFDARTGRHIRWRMPRLVAAPDEDGDSNITYDAIRVGRAIVLATYGVDPRDRGSLQLAIRPAK